jgi:hypothetical protein
MEFPLSRYQSSIESTLAIIPRDHLISRSEILSLDPEIIKAVQIIVHYTFDLMLSVNNYACLNETILSCVGKIINDLKEGSIIIAPGDSPSKLVHLLNLLYYHEDSNKWEYQTIDPQTGSPITVQKSLQFVMFPLSAAKSWPTPALTQYVQDVLQDMPISPDKMVYLDYVESGTTLNALNRVFRILFNLPDYELPEINLELACFDFKTQRCPDPNGLLMNIFAEAEGDQCRCLPSFNYNVGTDKLYQDPTPINVQRCNMTLILMYLKAISKLNSPPILPQFNISNYLFEDRRYYSIQFYDSKNSTITNEYGVVFYFTGRPNFYIVKDDAISFPQIYAKYILRLTPMDQLVPESSIDRSDNDKIGIATLINGQRVIGVLTKYNYLSAPPEDFINTTGYPSIKFMLLQHVIAFTPLN